MVANLQAYTEIIADILPSSYVCLYKAVLRSYFGERKTNNFSGKTTEKTIKTIKNHKIA